MRRSLRLAATIAAFALPADAQVPAVVTDIPVVQALVAMVMGDLGQPVLLLDRGADAHDFQLRPSQIRALNGADLVVWVGPEMTPWLDRALDAGGGGQRLALLHAAGTHLRRHEDAGDHAEADAAADHDHDGTDPHAWLDPGNAALWVGEVADALAELDPGDAAVYRANASLAQARIEELDRTLAERLAPARGKGLIMAHDAYGYFAERYGLSIAGSLAGGDASAPGAAHVAALHDLAETGAAVCIFPEAGHDPRGMEAITAGTAARLGRPLDPEGLAAEPGPDLYVDLLDALGTAIADCVAGK